MHGLFFSITPSADVGAKNQHRTFAAADVLFALLISHGQMSLRDPRNRIDDQ
jgi:hypothetical protein